VTSPIRRSLEDTAQAEAHVRELSLLIERERIAAELQDTVVQRVFAAGLMLQSAVGLTAEPEVRRRIRASIDELDEVIRQLRDAIFGICG
jgi:signal transduction histidine kinase